MSEKRTFDQYSIGNEKEQQQPSTSVAIQTFQSQTELKVQSQLPTNSETEEEGQLPTKPQLPVGLNPKPEHKQAQQKAEQDIISGSKKRKISREEEDENVFYLVEEKGVNFLGAFETKRSAILFCLKEILNDKHIEEFENWVGTELKDLDFERIENEEFVKLEKIVDSFNDFCAGFDPSRMFRVKELELLDEEKVSKELKEIAAKRPKKK